MITVDREEFQIKLDEINSLVSRKEYKAALEIVNSIDWRRVKNVRTLCMVGEIYAVNKKYSESREIFLLAYHRSQVGKTILYRLVEVSLKMKDFKEAQEYYEEFVKIYQKAYNAFFDCGCEECSSGKTDSDSGKAQGKRDDRTLVL